MAGDVMRRRMVNLVMVGADRITSNGDVVNKIGTYALAVLAKEHRIPFYSIAPTTTIDLSTPSGDQVKIEHRDPSEVIFVGKTRLVPKGVAVFNPAFDVTPSRLVTAIVTERGIVRPSELKSLFR
jgi:methylthioribose-1-phosphate isomerase